MAPGEAVARPQPAEAGARSGGEDHERALAVAAPELAAAILALADAQLAAAAPAEVQEPAVDPARRPEARPDGALARAEGDLGQAVTAHRSRRRRAARRCGLLRGVDLPGLLGRTSGTARVSLDLVVGDHAAGARAELRGVLRWQPRELARVARAAVDVEVRDPGAAVAARLVEEVVAVPLVGLRRAVVLDDRAAPVVATGSRSTWATAAATRAGSFERKSRTPSSVTFWWRLSKSTQYGSASGCGTAVPKPACCSSQRKGWCRPKARRSGAAALALAAGTSERHGQEQRRPVTGGGHSRPQSVHLRV